MLLCLQPAIGSQHARPRVGSQVMTPEMSELLRQQVVPSVPISVLGNVFRKTSLSALSPSGRRLPSVMRHDAHVRRSSMLIATLTANANESVTGMRPVGLESTGEVSRGLSSALASVADISDADVGVSACSPMLAIDYLKQVWTRWKVRPYRNGCTMVCCLL
jgi:hypothetical protein